MKRICELHSLLGLGKFPIIWHIGIKWLIHKLENSSDEEAGDLEYQQR